MSANPRVVAAITLIITFAAGVGVGIGVERLLRPQQRVKTIVASADMSGILDKLGLTASQRAAADSIVSRGAPRAEDMMRDLAARLRGVSDSLDAELRAILTDAQRARLDSLRTDQTVLLRRKRVGPGGTTVVDTFFRDSLATQRPPPR
jgi:hypothetical protein